MLQYAQKGTTVCHSYETTQQHNLSCGPVVHGIKSMSFRHLRCKEALLKLALVNQYPLQMGH